MDQKVLENKNKFIEIFKSSIKREGADKLLDYIENQSTFFVDPASVKYHGAYEGGLCEHSLNVYNALSSIAHRFKTVYGINWSDETIAICSLLHDLCKAGCYKVVYRNVKNELTGKWDKEPFYNFEDPMPYGHGEKSVYIIQAFMRLTREEAFAIRYHMGFAEEGDDRNVSQAYEKFPLALATSFADQEAAFIVESKDNL